MISLHPYVVPSFLTPLGAWAKVRDLKRKGFPEMRNWRFVTLTLNRSRYSSPEAAYEAGKKRLSRFVRNLRRAGYAVRRWCWKLELHESDESGNVYPHWHTCLDYKRKIPVEVIDKAWALGRTEIKCIDGENFDYLFKYVTKSVDELPRWVTERTSLRVFQTSPGFFPRNDEAQSKQEPSPRRGIEATGTNTQNNRSKETIGERMHRWSRRVVARSIIPGTGRYHFACAELNDGKVWMDLVVAACIHKFALNMGIEKITITETKIEAKPSCLHSLQRKLSPFLPASLSTV